MSKYLLFLTGVGGWSRKGQKYPYVILKWPLSMAQNKVIATCSIEHELRSYLVSLPVKEKKNKSENHFHKQVVFSSALPI